VSLDPLHEAVAALALGLPEAGQVALPGGGALLAHDLISRPTQDIDLFTPDPAELARVTEALTAALRDGGYVVDVTRRVDTFAHLDVASPDGRAMAVELAVDARIRDTVQLSFGPVLHPDEVTADKTLALFGRAAARDLADVDALAARYGHDRLLALATEKDPGFDRRVFADALSAAVAQPDVMYHQRGGCRRGRARDAVARLPSRRTGLTRRRSQRRQQGQSQGTRPTTRPDSRPQRTRSTVLATPPAAPHAGRVCVSPSAVQLNHVSPDVAQSG